MGKNENLAWTQIDRHQPGY